MYEEVETCPYELDAKALDFTRIAIFIGLRVCVCQRAMLFDFQHWRSFRLWVCYSLDPRWSHSRHVLPITITSPSPTFQAMVGGLALLPSTTYNSKTLSLPPCRRCSFPWRCGWWWMDVWWWVGSTVSLPLRRPT